MAKATTFFAFILLIFPAVYGANISVGGTSGWNLGVDYGTWAQGQTFTIQDVLVFTYGPNHSVAQVNQAGYQNCNSDPPVILMSPSPTLIPINNDATRYFICPTSDHCSRGMKLIVTVTSGSSAGTSPPSGEATVVLAGWNTLFVGVLVVVAALFGVIG